MQTSFLLVVCCLAISAYSFPRGNDLLEKWNQFKVDHSKKYSSPEEHEFRFRVFADNLIKIIRHNREYEEGKHTYKVKVNKFTDMLHSEYLDTMTVKMPASQLKSKEVYTLKNLDVPDTFDWRPKGAVTPVKDQGQCGSCWAFSSTGALEGQRFLNIGGLVDMSEQNLVDCSWSYGNAGCNGGWMNQAFQYIIDNSGIDTTYIYPYEARDGSCRFDPYYIGIRAKGFTDINYYDEAALKEAVATIGPIAVAIDASQPGFSSYSEGVYVDDRCDSQWSNHAVLVVGYGTENGQDYWLVKNSWGLSYGDEGYIKMARNNNNQCGIATQASYPLVTL